MNVACFVNENHKCISGIFTPLPTVNWWYANITNSEIFIWKGKKQYGEKGVFDDRSKEVLCSEPFESNSYYDPAISTTDCTCKIGYVKDMKNDGCVKKENLEVPVEVKTPVVVLPVQKNNKVIQTSTDVTKESPTIKSTSEISVPDEKKPVNPNNNTSETVKQQTETMGGLITRTVISWFKFLFHLS